MLNQAQALPMAGPSPVNLNGVMDFVPLSVQQQAEQERAEAAQQQPYVQGLAGHIREAWARNKHAKEEIETRMLKSLRQRHGRYEPDVLSRLREHGKSEIYMQLTSVKCRAATSWLRDVMLSGREKKPWVIMPTPIPELPPSVVDQMRSSIHQEVQMMLAQGQFQGANEQEIMDQIRDFVEQRKQGVLDEMRELAKEETEQCELKMEDQLIEGGFSHAFSQFIDDLSTFPVAVLKGPVVRRRKTLKWGPDGHSMTDETLRPEWDRVSPFDIYPGPYAESPNEGDFIERHRMSRSDLHSLIGVEGYSEQAIRAVLDEHGMGGLREWLSIDSEREDIEEKDDPYNSRDTIDALQFWGSVQGKHLLEWGMDENEVGDPLDEYEIEAWLIGRHVVKAVINQDPLARRPYYATSYEVIPGSFYGSSVADLVRDCQSMCNAAARALADNMGIASGPQVWVDNNRLAPGEQITEMFPWKIWQMQSDPAGGNQAPVGFFQPNSNSQELMAVYERYSILADEYSGIPRYMTGNADVPGAGRTASGMSMMMSNAGKSIKQVVANIDRHVLEPLIARLYDWNMMYSEDDDLRKTDIVIQARGVSGLIAQENAAVRRNEFLASTTNEIDLQIMGMDGRAALLHESAKQLDMNADKVVPPPDVIKARQQAQMMQQRQQQKGQGKSKGGPSKSGQELTDGAPVTDQFSPPRTS